MQEKAQKQITYQSDWQAAWANVVFRRKILITAAVLITIIFSLPSFFHYIEKREGAYLHDLILQAIPPVDVSLPTFLIIWSISGLVIVRMIQNPGFALLMLSSFTLLCITRMVSITLVPLDPPDGLIRLNDPLTSMVYGGKDKFMTKDLFFSGHTSNMFLMCLCLSKKTDKYLAFAATIAVGILVLVQHVHYTIDVLAAFLFTYIIFQVSKRSRNY